MSQKSYHCYTPQYKCLICYLTNPVDIHFAEAKGFEPLDLLRISCFQDKCIRPLCQTSLRAFYRNRTNIYGLQIRGNDLYTKKAVVGLVGFEPTRFWHQFLKLAWLPLHHKPIAFSLTYESERLRAHNLVIWSGF